ncbi:hypothetical protein ACFQ3C_11115 [Seohaeicola saemankumensis]|uniref:Porin n=1 Tax=Seohaeicola saemankumensis TaxID=481181 RepID=A0ABW3TGP3_9RHOB
MIVFKKLYASTAITAAFLACSAQAQTEAELEPLVMELEAALAGETFSSDVRRRAGIAAVPSGFGLSNGTASLSFSGSYGPERGDPDSTRFDASTAFSVGFGDPVNAVALEFGVVNTSFRNFGESGFFTVGANRQFSFAGGTGSVAVTVSDIEGWGDSKDNDVSGTATASFVYSINGRPVMATIGAGSSLTRDGDTGLIAGFGLSLAPDWAVSAGVVGESPIIGASYFPSALQGASVNFSLRDLDEGDDAVFGIDLGYSFNLFGR